MGGSSVERAQAFATNGKKKVYVWDMDETLILLKSLLNGKYAEAFGGSKDVQKGIEIGQTWEDHILQLCDDHFFYEQIEDRNTASLDALAEFDDGRDLSDYDFTQDGFSPLNDDSNSRKLAYRHRVIAHKYKQGLHGILDREKLKLLDDLYAMTDSYTDRWFSSALGMTYGGVAVSHLKPKKQLPANIIVVPSLFLQYLDVSTRTFLEECSDGTRDSITCVSSANGIAAPQETKFEQIHVLVTSGSLIPSLVKCLLFRLDHLIKHGNVYSSWELGKLQCFSLIRERFNGPEAQFCVIGDGSEECEAAETMMWPFVKIDFQPGGCHRFPGLTVRTVGHYLSVVYRSPSANSNEETLGQLQPVGCHSV